MLAEISSIQVTDLEQECIQSLLGVGLAAWALVRTVGATKDWRLAEESHIAQFRTHHICQAAWTLLSVCRDAALQQRLLAALASAERELKGASLVRFDPALTQLSRVIGELAIENLGRGNFLRHELEGNPSSQSWDGFPLGGRYA